METKLEVNPIIPFSIQIYLKSKKGAQDKYEEDKRGKIFSSPFKITKDSTVQWFQSRINHKILATNTL